RFAEWGEQWACPVSRRQLRPRRRAVGGIRPWRSGAWRAGICPAGGECPPPPGPSGRSAALYWTRSPVGLPPVLTARGGDRRSASATQRGAMTLPVGKLRGSFLAGLFVKHVTLDERVVLGPRVGEDAAVIDMGDRYLVATTDPITFVTEDL